MLSAVGETSNRYSTAGVESSQTIHSLSSIIRQEDINRRYDS